MSDTVILALHSFNQTWETNCKQDSAVSVESTTTQVIIPDNYLDAYDVSLIYAPKPSRI